MKKEKVQKSVQSWILSGIPIIFIIGSLMHFVYEWSGKSLIAGIFTPVNESVWEHLKMEFWPMLIWWIIGFFVLNKKNNIHVSDWLVSAAAAELTCLIFIVSFFYTYTGALGIEFLIIDIISFFLGIAVSQILSLHVFKYGNFDFKGLLIAVTVIALLIICFVFFTFNPPHLPLFKDPITGTYGI